MTIATGRNEARRTKLISVVICTYNRANLLANALSSTCKQTVRSSLYEVIVVDNNSNDQTGTVADDFCARYRNVRYVYERMQGLSHARNRGWREAVGTYVAYMDDDCVVPPNWLEVAKHIIESVSPGVFGGPYFVFYDAPPPRWFKDAYGSFQVGLDARFLGKQEYLRGGNIFFRRSLIESLGGFNPFLGMAGRKMAYGEETALLQRIRAKAKDETVYYDPALFVHHLVHARKMKLKWIIAHHFVSGRYAYLTLGEKRRFPGVSVYAAAAIAFSIVAFLFEIMRGLVSRDSRQYPYFENYFYERACRYIQSLGGHTEQLKSKWKTTAVD
jgi:glycosyltransferase involved in cell wall biosynthesis